VTVSVGCASTQPVAVVDVPRALQECREGRAAMSDLRALYETYQAQLEQRRMALEVTVEGIEADNARGLPTRQREAAAAREMQDIKAQYLRLQKQLSDEENRRAAPIRAHLESALAKLTETRRLGKVKQVDGIVPGVDRETDLTPELIQAMDAASAAGQP
jgi:Skp family chaperone for outer membrane proteins